MSLFLNFIVIGLNIYIEYEDYLKKNNEIDFDDMLTRAKERVYDTKTKYIIIKKVGAIWEEHMK